MKNASNDVGASPCGGVALLSLAMVALRDAPRERRLRGSAGLQADRTRKIERVGHSRPTANIYVVRSYAGQQILTWRTEKSFGGGLNHNLSLWRWKTGGSPPPPSWRHKWHRVRLAGGKITTWGRCRSGMCVGPPPLTPAPNSSHIMAVTWKNGNVRRGEAVLRYKPCLGGCRPRQRAS